MRGGRVRRRRRMLDVAKLDEWLSLNSREECLRCGAEQLAFAAFETGFMFAGCDACGHRLNVRIDTIRAIAFSDEAMKTLKVLSADTRLPITFRAECDMVLSLSRLYRRFFEKE
jgi:hypothetical protein